MPNTINEQQEQELYSNAYKLGHLFVKSIRYDDQDFWASFLIGVLEDKYLKLGLPLYKIRVPLRDGEPKDFKVTKDGVVEIKKYIPQYTLSEKQGFSKKQSVSVVSIDKKYYPPVFGHDKDRNEELVGVIFFSDKIEKNCKSSHVLPSIIISYDGGTVDRPYHFELLEEAEKYFKNKTQKLIWHDSVQSLIETDKISNKNLKRHNEILARLKWTGESKCQIGVFADNLKSRLIAQLRALDVKNNTGQEFIPISFYIFNKKSEEKIYPYYLKDQAKDLELALNDTSRTEKSEKLKIIALYIYFLKLNNNSQQAYNYLTNNTGVELEFIRSLFYVGRKKITEISRKIILNNIRNTICRNQQSDTYFSRKKQQKWMLLIAIDLEDICDINILAEFEYVFPNNALHLAVQWGKLKLIKRLLDCSRFDCNKVGRYGATPLLMAVEGGDIETVELLLTAPNIDRNKTDDHGFTPFFRAVMVEDIEIINLLLSDPNVDWNKANKQGVTPIISAVRDGKIEIVELILEKVDFNKFNNGKPLDLEFLIEEAKVGLKGTPENLKEMLDVLNKYKNQKNDNIQQPKSPTLKFRM